MHARASTLALFASFALAVPSLATQPGTPMDCSDLELAPGLTCTQLTPLQQFGTRRGESGFFESFPFQLPEDLELDNDSRLIDITDDFIADVGTCGTSTLRRGALLRVRVGDTWEHIAIAQRRCLDPTVRHTESIEALGLHFDSVRGSLIVLFNSSCFADVVRPSCPYNPGTSGPPARDGGGWLARIDGFTPLAEVLPPPPLPAPLCSNALDDDGDGRIDSADAHCKSDADNDESRP